MMVEQSDHAPLLDWEEVPSAEPPEKEEDLSLGPTNGSVPIGTAPGTGWSVSPGDGGRDTGRAGEVQNGPGLEALSSAKGDQPFSAWTPVSTKECRLTEWEEKDQIVAVFVVTFDTRSGNMVEWCLPREVDLDGVEFKSMASGSHRITNDFIYFRKGCFFGLACFANMPVESELERGARMKSVGVLTPSYTLLYRYMHFLENQVRHQLQWPGQYSPLEAFYEDKKAVLPIEGNGLVTACPPSAIRAPPQSRCCMNPEMKITHPAGCMSQFACFFGEQIMVLWKFALLRKRVLMFSPPPVGVVCYRVPELRPFFYINVADISALETEMSYVACTTEKIFEEKRELYDVYVDNQNVKTHRDSLRPMLQLSDADRERYRKLSEQRQMLLYSQEVDGDSGSSEEDLFILFFMEQNNRIFQTLCEAANSADPSLTADHVRAMGLDPQGDRSFLMDLLELYGIDVMLLVDNPCCH